MKTTRFWILLGATSLAGCGLFATPSDAITDYSSNSIEVAWGPIPSPDGGSLAVVLESRTWESIQTGVLGLGTLVTEAAPAVVVTASGQTPGMTVDTLSLGMTSTRLGPTTAWVLQATTTTSWTVLSYDVPADIAPDGGLYGLCNGSTATSGDDDDAGDDGDDEDGGLGLASFDCSGIDIPDYAPTPSFTQATRIDRTSLKITASRPLVPAIFTPVVMGDDLLVGLPAPGASDVARNVSILAYSADEAVAPTVVHEENGYGVSLCSGASGVALAYEPASDVGSTTIVSATYAAGAWQTYETSLPHTRPGTGMACSADGTRVLVATVDSVTADLHVTLVDVASAAVVADAQGLTGPLAIASDGQSGIAASAVDMTLLRLTANGAMPLDGGASLSATPILNGDLALWSLVAGYAIVHVNEGTIEPPVAPVSVASPVAWAQGGGFVVPVLEADPMNYDPELTHLYVVTAGHTADLPLGNVVDNPSLVPPAGTTLYLQTQFNGVSSLDSEDGGSVPATPPHLLTYDLSSLTLTSETVFPSCNTAKTLADAGCSP